jgi:hypothetical protein
MTGPCLRAGQSKGCVGARSLVGGGKVPTDLPVGRAGKNPVNPRMAKKSLFIGRWNRAYGASVAPGKRGPRRRSCLDSTPLRLDQPPLAAALLARRRVDPAARSDLLHGRISLSAARVALDLGGRADGLRLLHASPDCAPVDTGQPPGNDTGRPILREVREGPPASASYLSARSRRRFLVNGSAFLARSRARSACCLKNLLSNEIPPHNNARNFSTSGASS